MARGWESKSIEAQQDEASRAKEPPGRPPTPEEVALTRNASEALETVQLGLPHAPGDELLTTTQDYPRMITTFQQRERRDEPGSRHAATPWGPHVFLLCRV